MSTRIFHIVEMQKWQQAQAEGHYETPSLHSEGFIHCSVGPQVCDVANMRFKGKKQLHLLVIETTKLKHRLVFEGETQNVYPHIYGTINVDAVSELIPFPESAQGFLLPERAKHLCPYHHKIQQLLKESQNEPLLKGHLTLEKEESYKLPIWLGSEIVGFAIPKQDPDQTWRMGAIYVQGDARNKKLARKAIADFMTNRKGKAFLETKNLAAQKSFAAAGFRKVKEVSAKDGAWWQNY